ncbi:MAG: SpoIID/LytB domain-containing protein, partial [Anaerotignum sp.]
MKKLLGVMLFYILLAVLLLPFLVTLLCGGFRKEIPQEAKVLYGLADLAPLDSELEEYVVGVVAAEMPAAFPEEALKAQAVAARTYQVRQMQAADSDAVLYDVGQAYITEGEQKKKWGENYAFYAAK